MKMHARTRILPILAVIVIALTALPVSAGLFEWSRLGRLIPQTGFEPSVSAIASDPTKAAILYAGTLRSADNTSIVFKSANGGVSWQSASAGLPDVWPQNTGVNDLLVRPDLPTTLYAGLYNAGVWESTNGGQSWVNSTNGSIAANDTVQSLAIDPSRPQDIYALTGTGVHISVGGDAWQSRSSGLPSASATLFQDISADPTHAGTLYVATNPQGLFRTMNGGQSWEAVNKDLPAGDLNVRGVSVGPVSGQVLISVGGYGLWRSDDLGASWTRSDNGITYNTTLSGNVGLPVFSPSVAGTVYVYNNDGAFASVDGGHSWAAFNDGLSGAETVSIMAFNAAAPNTVYAGTSISGTWSLTVVPGGRSYVPTILR
jgi:hypothetical protein